MVGNNILVKDKQEMFSLYLMAVIRNEEIMLKHVPDLNWLTKTGSNDNAEYEWQILKCSHEENK